MSLDGEYEPSPEQWVRDQAEQLQDGPAPRDMVARELSGDERAQWWERAVTAFRDYADYQTKTDRQIPVFLLEPAGQ